MGNSAILRSTQRQIATDIHNPTYQAYELLHIGFTIAPIVAGADKFLHYLTNWNKYLSPLVSQYIAADVFMSIVGVIEILAGILVAFKPKIGGVVVGMWLLGIVVNLLTMPEYYDVALRDFGLALGAFALARLATRREGK